MSKKSEKRQHAALQQLLSNGVARVTAPDFKTIDGKVFHSMTCAYFDRQTGPFGISAQFANGKMTIADDAAMFPLANTTDRELKTRIANHVLDARIDERWLLDGGASVLLGPGSTVFHVAWELASRLRQGIEQNSRTVFDSHEFISDWHTDSFEIARLLGPLATRDWAPNVHWTGCLVSRKSVDSSTIGLRMKQRLREPGTISTLILGCEEVDAEGNIYTKLANHVAQIEDLINEANNTVIVVATGNKLFLRGGAKERMVKYDPKDRNFFLVTETEPTPLHQSGMPPKGFRRIIWPGGEWKEKS